MFKLLKQPQKKRLPASLLFSTSAESWMALQTSSRHTVMMSKFGSAAVSDGVEDGVSPMEGVAHSRLDSGPPALQLGTLQQDITAAGRRLRRRDGSLICSQKPRVIQSQPLTCMSSQMASRSATVMSSPHRNGCLRRNMDSSLSRVSSS